MTPAEIIAAVQARGSDARDLRDAAHEACHALEFDVPDGAWDRVSVDKYAQRIIRRKGGDGRSFALRSETFARAVEQMVCADLGVACDSIERWALVACMEAVKIDRVSYPLDGFVRLVKMHMGTPEAREMADRIKALPPMTQVQPRRRGLVTARWIEVGEGPSPPRVLSKTTAHILVNRSPLHANLHKARRLEEEESEEERKTKDRGTIVHAMLLGASNKKIVVLDFDEYRTKEAKAARDAVKARGDVPVKAKEERIYSVQADRIRREIERQGFILDGRSEIGTSWIEPTTDGSGDEVECMGALDHWRPSCAQILDVKTVRSAHPDACRKHLYAFGCDIQAAAYLSAVEKIHPQLAGRVRFFFLFCELASGAVTPVELAGDFLALGRSRWQRAVNLWARCLREDHWPGYVQGPITMSAPEWALSAEETARAADFTQQFEKREQPAGKDAGEEIEDVGADE